MSNLAEEVVDYLVAWRENKKHYENTKIEIRNELMRIAVRIGVPQEEAFAKDLPSFFDGWLVARGHIQAHRKTKEENEDDV